MRLGLVRPLIAAAAVASVITGVTLARTIAGEPSSPPSESPPVAASAEGECPSPEEMEAYWEEHGVELKTGTDCGDPDPVPPGEGETHYHDESDHQPPETLEEAQALLDPEDDPLILIAQNAQGFYAVTIAVTGEDAVPPTHVRTERQYARWIDGKEAAK
jgi:hypothetical protein